MRFEKTIARLIGLYVILSFVILASVVRFYVKADIMSERIFKYYVILIFSAVAFVVVIHFERRNIGAEKTHFIKKLVSGRGAGYRKHKRFVGIYHAFRLVRHIQKMEEEKSEHLDSILNHYDFKISDLENEAARLRLEKQKYLLELEAAELKFVALANSVEHGILVVDREGRVTFANNILINRFPAITVGDHLSGVLDVGGDDHELFMRRNHRGVAFRMWDKSKSIVALSSSRVFARDALCNIIFLLDGDYANTLSADIIKRNQEFNFMLESLATLSGKVTELKLRQYLERLCLFCDIDSASVRVLSEDKQTLKLYISYCNNAFILNKEEISVRNSNMGAAFEEQKLFVISDAGSMKFPEKHVENLLKKGYTVSYFPLGVQTANIGVLSLVSKAAPGQNAVLILKSVCVNLAIALEKILLYDTLKNNYFDVIKAFLKAYELKIKHRRGHSVRVAMICRLIANKLYYDEDETDKIYNAALLHDIGKMLIMDDTDEYEAATADHSQLGRRIMEKVGFEEEILQGIEYHHENYRTENGILPIYPQFIRLANDFDTYVESAPTGQRAQEFIEQVCRATEDVYSPNLVNVLESIIAEDIDSLLGIYGVGDA